MELYIFSFLLLLTSFRHNVVTHYTSGIFCVSGTVLGGTHVSKEDQVQALLELSGGTRVFK